MDPKEERQLIEDAKHSLAAFDKLYEMYLPKIYAYILNRTGKKHIAEDITSDTFLKAIKNIGSYKDKGYTFGPWLYRIAHNTLVDYFRKNKHLNIWEELDAKDDTNLDTEVIESEERTIMLKAVAQLPEQYQEIISLKYFEELSNDEIAEILDCKKQNVALKTHRALNSLKDILKSKHYLKELGLDFNS